MNRDQPDEEQLLVLAPDLLDHPREVARERIGRRVGEIEAPARAQVALRDDQDASIAKGLR